jgi:hypothetical protein
MNGYVTKPIRPAELFKVIAEFAPPSPREEARLPINHHHFELRSGQ